MKPDPNRILLSRTDGIGDVMLSLPVAGFLKSQFPDCQIYFLGKNYTKPVIEGCRFIDGFVDVDEFLTWKANLLNLDVVVHLFPHKKVAAKAFHLRIPIKIGTNRRWFHFLYCNQLVSLSRRNSTLHEAQLNLKLLPPLVGPVDNLNPDFEQLSGFSSQMGLEPAISNLIDPNKIKVILHPKSKGSAREWGMNNFSSLIDLLTKDGRFQVLISGTTDERPEIEPVFQRFPAVVDLVGKVSLAQLIAIISSSDVLVAASTGPLHIASALGKIAVGLYAPMKPIHAGRWGPIGNRSSALTIDKDCSDCRKSGNCVCIRSIEVVLVFKKIKELTGTQSD